MPDCQGQKYKKKRDDCIIPSLWFDVYALLGDVCFLNGLWRISNLIIDCKYWLIVIIIIIIIIIDKYNQIYKLSTVAQQDGRRTLFLAATLYNSHC